MTRRTRLTFSMSRAILNLSSASRYRCSLGLMVWIAALICGWGKSRQRAMEVRGYGSVCVWGGGRKDKTSGARTYNDTYQVIVKVHLQRNGALRAIHELFIFQNETLCVEEGWEKKIGCELTCLLMAENTMQAQTQCKLKHNTCGPGRICSKGIAKRPKKSFLPLASSS